MRSAGKLDGRHGFFDFVAMRTSNFAPPAACCAASSSRQIFNYQDDAPLSALTARKAVRRQSYRKRLFRWSHP